jgi:polyphosphate kinase
LAPKKKRDSQYFNRELSWLQFNDRVLSLALNNDMPLLERAKFHGIFASNLDEFFMVRVATLLRRIELKDKRPDPSGRTPDEQLAEVLAKVRLLLKKQANSWQRSLYPKLENASIKVLTYQQLAEQQRDFCRNYFYDNIASILSPMACDLGHPFPVLQNRQLYFAVESIIDADAEQNHLFSILPVPDNQLPRIIELPGDDSAHNFIFLEEVIRHYIGHFYLGNTVTKTGLFRITRDAEFSLEEADAEDLLQLIESQLKERRRGAVVRVELEQGIANNLVKRLKKEMQLQDDQVFRQSMPIDLGFLFALYGRNEFDHLKDKTLKTYVPRWESDDIFSVIAAKDRFLHHPYEQFDPVIELLERAASDPNVMAIKQVLYRVSAKSPVIEALSKAAESGKQVSVLMELQARFDEENNIEQAQRLERAGCHVVHGVMGLKTHAKALLIIRREVTGIRRYVHLATGNYNEKTARLYSDCGMMTTREDIAEDVSHLFNVITGYSRPNRWRNLGVAPINLSEKIIELIHNEIQRSHPEMPGHIFVKVNSLLDKKVINALYEASQNNVRVDLVVRGICGLIPGVAGISENIFVKSIVGRYLEHPRLFRFKNGNDPVYYLSSADWMPRNLHKRIEAFFPVLDRDIQRELDVIIEYNMMDNLNSWQLMPDGEYEKISRRGKTAFDLFTEFHRHYQEMHQSAEGE